MMLQLKPWGASQSLRIPKSMLAILGMESGDFFEVEQLDSERIVLVKKSKSRLSLSQRLANSENAFFVDEEFDTAPSVGEELI